MSEERTQRDLLVGLQRFEFQKASKLDRWVFYLQVAAGVLAVASLTLPRSLPRATALPSLLSLAVAVATLMVGWKNLAHRMLGEKARRATLLVDGKGLRLSDMELRRFASLAKTTHGELEKWNDPGYFVTAAAPGTERATEMLEESAFWSAYLFRASAEMTLKWMLITLGLAAAFLLVGLEVLPIAASSLWAKLFSAVATAIVSVELLTRWRDYGIAAQETDSILTRLEQLRRLSFPEDDFLLALVDYNSVVEGAPLMAPGVFDKNRERLNRMWEETMTKPREAS